MNSDVIRYGYYIQTDIKEEIETQFNKCVI